MECSGCGSCALVCPKKCITMSKNANGFIQPVKIDINCTNCSLCDKVCPIAPQKSREANSLNNMKLYSAFAKDSDVRNTTSSGGVAYCLAKNSIELGYGVCGVVFNYSTMRAEHKVLYTIAEIEKLKGSKYIQSSNYKAFDEMLQVLHQDNDRKFVVFGTPCQIAGLDSILLKRQCRDRVLLVDIYCHGVPSDLLWDKYLRYIQKKLKIKDFSDIEYLSFRDKKYSWHKYHMHIKGKNYDYISPQNSDPFLRLFTMGVVNQSSCFACNLRNQSFADIRLGDYWGKRFADSEKGFSMVLVNTARGKSAINNILNAITIEQQEINERFNQQHTNFEYPQYYKKSISMLKDTDIDLKKVISLYDSKIDRFKRTVKKIVKYFFKL